MDELTPDNPPARVSIGACLGLALALGPGMMGLLALSQLSKLEVMFIELAIALPAITESLVNMGATPVALLLLSLILWPIIVLLLRAPLHRVLPAVILLNGAVVSLFSAIIVIACYLPLVEVLNQLS